MGDTAMLTMRERYPDATSCRIAICELRSLLDLPAGTTYYFCDIHGQGSKFFHIVNNKAGTIKRKIDDVLAELAPAERVRLLKVCYYPREELAYEATELGPDFARVFEGHVFAIARLIRHVGSKTTRREFYGQIESSRFHAAILELVTSSNDDKIVGPNSRNYQQRLVDEYRAAGLEIDLAADMVRILKNLLIHKYVINGDIPDRGPDTARILDHLVGDARVSINWGNHDLLWMGAAAGSRELVAELVRIQLRYGYQEMLETDYGISLAALAAFAVRTYRSEPVRGFQPASPGASGRYDTPAVARMQKAIAVILWKLEAARPDDLGVTPYLNLVRRATDGVLSVRIGDTDHPLLDQDFPTFDPRQPAALTRDERRLIDDLTAAFRKSARLQRQMRHLAVHGALYCIQDGILSFHATVPVNDDGSLRAMPVLGESLAGRALFDRLAALYRQAYSGKKPSREVLDLFYSGWKGPHSWTFGKSGMETFTRALVADTATHRETKSAYYRLLGDPQKGPVLSANIIADFMAGGSPSRIEKIFNGHIPVKLEKNESAVKAGGTVICGDGGFSEAYGDIGFVLVTTSSGLYLNRLGRSVTAEEVLAANEDIVPQILWEERYLERKRLSDCNIAPEIMARIAALEALLGEYAGH